MALPLRRAACILPILNLLLATEAYPLWVYDQAAYGNLLGRLRVSCRLCCAHPSPLPGYVYSGQERPSFNVPAAVQQAEISFFDACGSNLTNCTPAADPVSVSWLLNSVDSVDDLNQVVTLDSVRAVASPLFYTGG